jgi:hypothetical protein
MNDGEAQLDRIIAAAKRHDRPSASTTQRAWAELDAAIIAGTGPSVPVDVGASAAASGAGIKSLVIVGITVITAATTAIIAGAIESRDRDPIAAARPAAAPTMHAAPSPLPPAVAPAAIPPAMPIAEPLPAADVPASEPTPVVRAGVRPQNDRSVATPGEAPATSTLAEQARLLGQAWRAINDGDTALALSQLQDHLRRFPDSALAQERDAARIVAWCTAKKPWANEHARRFLAAHEGGTLADRVARACDSGESEKE